MLAGSLLAPAMFARNTVNARRENQQDRIAQGVKSGQLSDKETAKLETREQKPQESLFLEDFSLPSGLVGPQDFSAFARFAAICFSVAMVDGSFCWFEVAGADARTTF